MKTRIHALLKTRSPLHIAHPNNARIYDNGQIFYGGRVPKTFECTAIQKLRITNGDGIQDLPVIAANNVAGRLRRRAAELVLKAVKSKGQKFNLQTYSVLMCGAATGTPDTEDMTYQEYVASRNHVYFGLFGGGPKMFERKVRVHNALPVTAQALSLRGALSHPNAERHIVPDKRMTSVWGFRRVDDLRDLTNIEMAESTIEDFHAVFEKRQSEILADKEVQPGEKSKTSTKTYSAIEFVVPGVVFDLTFELDVATEAQMGLFLLALDALAENERLGGYVRNGFGVFSLDDVVMVTEDGERVTIFQNGRLVRDADPVGAWLKAWVDAAAVLDAKSIDRLVAMSEESAKKAAKKAEKSAS